MGYEKVIMEMVHGQVIINALSTDEQVTDELMAEFDEFIQEVEELVERWNRVRTELVLEYAELNEYMEIK